MNEANSFPPSTVPATRRRPVYVYGAGGHSQVVGEVLEEMGFTVEAFLNDHPDRRHFAVSRTLPGRLLAGTADFPGLDAPLVLAVGSNRDRKRLVELLDVEWVSAIHPSATIAPTVELGADSVILHGAIIQAHSRIGSHVLINTGARVDHDNAIGDYAHISPNATLCGDVEIGEGTLVGAAATVIPAVKIGSWCTIGAGSVVTVDIPDQSTASGVPARIHPTGP